MHTNFTSSGSRAHGEAIPIHTQLRARQREQFDDATELEGAEPIVGDGHDKMRAHGAMLPDIGDCATAFIRSESQ